MSLGDSYPSAGRSGAPILYPAVLGSLLPFEPAPRELQVHAVGLLIASAPLKLLLHLKKKEAPTPKPGAKHWGKNPSLEASALLHSPDVAVRRAVPGGLCQEGGGGIHGAPEQARPAAREAR